MAANPAPTAAPSRNASRRDPGLRRRAPNALRVSSPTGATTASSTRRIRAQGLVSTAISSGSTWIRSNRSVPAWASGSTTSQATAVIAPSAVMTATGTTTLPTRRAVAVLRGDMPPPDAAQARVRAVSGGPMAATTRITPSGRSAKTEKTALPIVRASAINVNPYRRANRISWLRSTAEATLIANPPAAG